LPKKPSIISPRMTELGCRRAIRGHRRFPLHPRRSVSVPSSKNEPQPDEQERGGEITNQLPALHPARELRTDRRAEEHPDPEQNRRAKDLPGPQEIIKKITTRMPRPDFRGAIAASAASTSSFGQLLHPMLSPGSGPRTEQSNESGE